MDPDWSSVIRAITSSNQRACNRYMVGNLWRRASHHVDGAISSQMNEPELPRGCTVFKSEFQHEQLGSRCQDQFRMRITSAAVDRRRKIYPRQVGYRVSI
jgi:hypothetical protein